MVHSLKMLHVQCSWNILEHLFTLNVCKLCVWCVSFVCVDEVITNRPMKTLTPKKHNWQFNKNKTKQKSSNRHA